MRVRQIGSAGIMRLAVEMMGGGYGRGRGKSRLVGDYAACYCPKSMLASAINEGSKAHEAGLAAISLAGSYL